MRCTASWRLSSTGSPSADSVIATWPRRSCRTSSCRSGGTPGSTTPRAERCGRGSTASPATRSSTRSAVATADRAPPSVSREEPIDADEPIEGSLLRWQVNLAFERLTPEHRAIVHQTQVQGLKLREIAEQSGLPLGTVKSRAHYALENLRLALEELGVTT